MAALPFVLGGLAVAGGSGKLIWDKFLKVPPNTPYDIVVRLNSLLALKTSGWDILLSENTRSVSPQNSTGDNVHGLVVGVLGSYNRGKSFFLNLLCHSKLPSGKLISTEGISITIPKKTSENIIFIDTAGTDTAIPKDKLDDKKATEALLREVALHLSSFIIIVVNRLRATDQTYIQQVLQHAKESQQKKEIIIVHNLMDVETVEDANEVIHKEVEQLFDSKKDTIILQMGNQQSLVEFFGSENNGIKLRHFVLTKVGSPSAQIWNQRSIDGIMSILQVATSERRDLNVIGEMIHFINTKLPQIFITENVSGEDPQQKFEVQLNAKRTNIVLSQRRELEDLSRNPVELTLSPKLAYDEAGYFIGIGSMDYGQWQPFYDLYETDDDIYVIIDLAGFKKENMKTKVMEKAIVLEGSRDDLKTQLPQPVVRHQKIPFGRFKLDISLPAEIELVGIKPERDDGLYKIKCSKKKTTAIYLE
ncbi:unnamed protein product [Adineta ricciae]|uniref:SHSP domain-containing protein n=1 Tax=Adineta ricciae TaxID=249248 RepID=A0A816B897_ADIRI|nr:unnamed protein product [Adineta ricciae]